MKNEMSRRKLNAGSPHNVVLALAAAFVCGSSLGAELPLDEHGNWKEDVLFVETDGSASYFDTGVKVGPNTHVVTCVAFQSWPAFGTAVGAGGSPTAATIAFSPSGANNGGDVWRTNVGTWDDPGWKNSTIKADKNFHVWSLRSGSQRLDGLPLAATTIAADAPAVCSFTLGARAVAFNGATSQTINSHTKMRIRSCQIYDGTDLVKDYVAAYQNGKYGLLDRKSGAFLVSPQGTVTGQRRKAAIPVAYVESKCMDLHVDTGIRPTETTRVVADMAFMLNNGTLMGSGGTDVASILFGTAWGDAFQWAVGGTYSVTTTGGKKDMNRHVWDLSSGSQKIDDKQYATATIPAGAAPGPSFILFARRLVTNTGVDSWHQAKIWNLKIYDGIALLRDLQPCYWNDRYCLLDRVTGQFLQAVGTSGDSSYGLRDLTGEPLDLTVTRRSFLKTSGNQYIDTRVKVKSETRLWAQMAFLDGGENRTQCMGWASQLESGKISLLLGPNSDGKFGGWFGASYSATKSYEKTADTALHVWEFQKGSQKIDGVEMATQTAENYNDNFDDSDTFFLFCRNRRWDKANPDWFSKVKVYGFKIWKGNELVRDFVPAEVGGRACLYDEVNKLPYFSPVGDELYARDDGTVLLVH